MELEQPIRIIWGILGATVAIFGLALWASRHRHSATAAKPQGLFIVAAVVLGLGLAGSLLAGWRPPEKEQPTYPERLNSLRNTVRWSYSEIDSVLAVADERKRQRLLEVDALYAQLEELEKEEAALKRRIEALRKIDPQEVEYLVQLSKKEEERDAGGGYGSYVAGVATFAVVSMMMRRFSSP